ncbi:MAG: hypothetical protein RBS39_02635 [Phycisphaerales bacterium]|jgi:hypothetical protein|nr:hypothetical protein [Phycisphaerales bacterium]
MKKIISAFGLALFAGSALAQAPGDIVFTNTMAVGDQRVDWYSVSGNINTTLFTFNDNLTQLSDLELVGNTWYAVDRNQPPVSSPTSARVVQINDLFGTPVASTLATSDPIQRGDGLRYDPNSGQLLFVNNPGSADAVSPRFEGILGINPSNGNVTEIYQQPSLASPLPRWTDGIYMDRDVNSNDFFVVTGNGGAFGGSGELNGSTLQRLSVDPNTLQGTAELIVDLSDTSVTGLSVPLQRSRGVVAIPGTNDVYINDIERAAIYKITLDSNGDFQSIIEVNQGIWDSATDMTYDPFTNTLVIGNAGTNSPGLYRMTLDGSTVTTLVSGVFPRGIIIIPAPGAVGLLGAAGLVAMRRRR